GSRDFDPDLRSTPSAPLRRISRCYPPSSEAASRSGAPSGAASRAASGPASGWPPGLASGVEPSSGPWPSGIGREASLTGILLRSKSTISSQPGVAAMAAPATAAARRPAPTERFVFIRVLSISRSAAPHGRVHRGLHRNASHQNRTENPAPPTCGPTIGAAANVTDDFAAAGFAFDAAVRGEGADEVVGGGSSFVRKRTALVAPNVSATPNAMSAMRACVSPLSAVDEVGFLLKSLLSPSAMIPNTVPRPAA